MSEPRTARRKRIGTTGTRRAGSTGRESAPVVLVPALPRRIHLLGIGGAGLSGAARILAARGHRLSGHDRSRSSMSDALAPLGLELCVGESRSELLPRDVELVARSAAVPLDDPQVVEARRRGLPVLKYAELLPRLAAPERTLAVAGTHGKTTTSWLLFHALRALHQAEFAPVGPERPVRPERAERGELVSPDTAPGALVGGLCRALGTNAVAGGPDGWFAVEACEYDRSFLQLRPFGAIVTNVDADHLDYYGTLGAIREAFARFADRVHPSGLLVLGADVPDSVESAAACRTWRLGRELECRVVGRSRGCARFALRAPGFAAADIELAIPGDFNAENAALALALAVGVSGAADPVSACAAAARGASAFPGAARRFEPWGQAAGIELVHDYAHHPVELRATLTAARERYPGRPLVLLFQPHQHSRTARFLDEFADELARADRVIVADVYGARTHIDGQRTAGASELVAAVRARGTECRAGGPLASSAAAFLEAIAPGDVGLVIGAGDVESIQDELLRDLALCGDRRRGPVG